MPFRRSLAWTAIQVISIAAAYQGRQVTKATGASSVTATSPACSRTAAAHISRPCSSPKWYGSEATIASHRGASAGSSGRIVSGPACGHAAHGTAQAASVSGWPPASRPSISAAGAGWAKA